MIRVPSGVRFWLATGVTDMRRGMNTLALQVQQDLGRDPHVGGSAPPSSTTSPTSQRSTETTRRIGSRVDHSAFERVPIHPAARHEIRPLLQELATPSNKVRSRIGLLHRRPHRMRQAQLHDRVRRVRAFRRPVSERSSETRAPSRVWQALSCAVPWSASCPTLGGRASSATGTRAPTRRATDPHFPAPPVPPRSEAPDAGRRPSSAPLECAIRAPSRRSLPRPPPRASPDRAAVRTRNRKHSRAASDASDASTVSSASVTSR